MDSGTGIHQEQMKAATVRIQEYLQSQTEDSLQNLLRDLTLLESSGDALLLDISTMKGIQFYTNLHELLVVVESTNPLVWSAISILQKACIDFHKGFHSILSDMYVPVLGKLLNDSLPHDKKLKLLTLLQVLTHGLNIQWQAPYLQPMVKSVIALVMSSDPKEAYLSLSILVNLLHRNPPVKHTFLRSVKVKDFLKQLLRRDISLVEFRLEELKLMILSADLSEICSDIKEIKKFVALTFQTINESIQNGKIYLAQRTVSFFGDVTQVEKLKSALKSYPCYEEDINSILKILEGESVKQDCTSILLDLFGHLVSLLPLEVIHIERLVSVISKIISSGDLSVRPCALDVLLLISKKSVLQTTPELPDLHTAYHRIMPVLVGLLNEPIPRKNTTTVLQLLCEFTKLSSMKKDMISCLDLNVLRAFFEPFISEWHPARSSLTVEDALFYVEALNLISEFVSQDARYLQLFSWLSAKNCVLFAIATALKCGSPSVTSEILKFPGKVGFSNESVDALAENLSQVPVTAGKDRTFQRQTDNLTSYDTSHLFGEEERARLDGVLSSLEKPEEMPLSALMSVFHYRIDAAAREQRILLSSLEMANRRIIHLSSQIEASRDETQQLSFCLLDTQMKLEKTKVERDAAFAAEVAAETKASVAVKNSQEKVRALEGEIIELKRTIEVLKKKNDVKDVEIEKLVSRNQTLCQDLADLENKHKANLRLLLEKEEEIKEKNAHIQELEIIKKAINEITSGKKKVEK